MRTKTRLQLTIAETIEALSLGLTITAGDGERYLSSPFKGMQRVSRAAILYLHKHEMLEEVCRSKQQQYLVGSLYPEWIRFKGVNLPAKPAKIA